MDIFYFMPLELWKDMAERFLDPVSFGRLRQVNRALRNELDEESKEKMVKRCTVRFHNATCTWEIFMNRAHTVLREGTQVWTKKARYHRDNDLPAIILGNGSKRWYRNGEFHRDNDLPALMEADGTKKWYQNGLLHRDGGQPAVIYPGGRKRWYKDGKRIK